MKVRYEKIKQERNTLLLKLTVNMYFSQSIFSVASKVNVMLFSPKTLDLENLLFKNNFKKNLICLSTLHNFSFRVSRKHMNEKVIGSN